MELGAQRPSPSVPSDVIVNDGVGDERSERFVTGALQQETGR